SSGRVRGDQRTRSGFILGTVNWKSSQAFCNDFSRLAFADRLVHSSGECRTCRTSFVVTMQVVLLRWPLLIKIDAPVKPKVKKLFRGVSRNEASVAYGVHCVSWFADHSIGRISGLAECGSPLNGKEQLAGNCPGSRWQAYRGSR